MVSLLPIIVDRLGAACPCGDELEHCPFREMRLLSPNVRRKKILLMTSSQHHSFIAYHLECLRIRMSQR